MDENSVPGFMADPGLQAKLDSLDDQLQPIEEVPSEKPKTEEAGTEEDNETNEEVEQVAEEDESVEDESTEEVSEDEGYSIDEGDEEEAEEVPTTSTEEAKSTPNLTAEQSYILENLSPITVRGSVGDGKVESYEVLSPEQLPQGFKYVDERESSIANKNFAMLESKALTLQNDFRTQESTKAAAEFKTREDNADRSDIAELQKAGDLPKFKLQQTDPKFESDPGVKLVQDILDFKEEQNQKYMEEYNAGRPYKHIGFQEAYAMYQRANPVDNSAQNAEDKAREAVAKRTSGTRGATTKNQAERVRSGMMSRDLDALIESKTAGW